MNVGEHHEETCSRSQGATQMEVSSKERENNWRVGAGRELELHPGGWQKS